MTFDTTVPEHLKHIQQWFASIITRPIDLNNKMNPVSPSGNLMDKEACQYISPSPTLQPARRIELYNQQYWWRLLSTLQENFPLVTRLFGYGDFNNTIAVPYLEQNPPTHWSLAIFGDTLPKWIDQNYTASDKALVLHASQIDWAYIYSFIATNEIGLTAQDDLNQLMDVPLTLQQHVGLFEIPFDLFKFREEMLKEEPEYWLKHDFPKLRHAEEGKQLYFVLFRTHSKDIAYEEISKSEFESLQRFSNGSSISDLCEWLEEAPEEVSAEAGENLHLWFQRWTTHQFLKPR